MRGERENRNEGKEVVNNRLWMKGEKKKRTVTKGREKDKYQAMDESRARKLSNEEKEKG